jgi:uncharacterized protein YnzC (UPF0291/DUF896 family)
MDKVKIGRINELAKKAKTCGLTSDEKEEQKVLRQEYIKAFRSDLKSQLDCMVLVDKNGNRRSLKKNN